MLVVLTIISLMAGLAAPSVLNGIDSVRLSTAADSVVAFLNSAQNASERRQVAVEITFDPAARRLEARSSNNTYQRQYELADGINIDRVLPDLPDLPDDQPRRVLLLPGGAVPRIVVVLKSQRGSLLQVAVDPINGNASIVRGAPEG